MSPVDPAFGALLAATFALHWTLRGARARNALLAAASVTFYGWSHAWMALVLLCVGLTAYLAGLAIAARPTRARWIVAGVVAIDLATLCVFKYVDWLGGGVVDLASALAGVELPRVSLGLVLPLGLSFYTFQTLGYVIDVSRGSVRARANLVDFLAFAAFFPPLVAGPVERAGRLLPQLERERVLDWASVRSGLTLAAWGLLVKIVVADTLAPYVEAVGSLRDPPGMVAWAASLTFGVQLYADFAGYTHLARGAARLFGFELVENFHDPFLATSTPDFWRRWHVSLSSWLRDYLLVPLLGGGSTSPLRLAAALTVTFVAIGVWHGAGWHYVAFGLWHAASSLAYLAIGPLVPESLARRPIARLGAALLHGALVLTPGSFLFRGPTLAAGWARLTTPPWQGDADAAVVASALLCLAGAGAAVLITEWAARRSRLVQGAWVLPAQTTAWAAVAVAIAVFHPVTVRDFVYFRF